jgi:hypothetical protein
LNAGDGRVGPDIGPGLGLIAWREDLNQQDRISKSAFFGVVAGNQDGSWPNQPFSITTGELVLESIDFHIPLAAAYRTTRLAANK